MGHRHILTCRFPPNGRPFGPGVQLRGRPCGPAFLEVEDTLQNSLSFSSALSSCFAVWPADASVPSRPPSQFESLAELAGRPGSEGGGRLGRDTSSSTGSLAGTPRTNLTHARARAFAALRCHPEGDVPAGNGPTASRLTPCCWVSRDRFSPPRRTFFRSWKEGWAPWPGVRRLARPAAEACVSACRVALRHFGSREKPKARSVQSCEEIFVQQ
jgi:hypothetical protein